MRRMRTPLIVLILLFTVSVVGLAIIPGSGPAGPWHMSLFDAFYVMSYTATTIGYGEIPQAFNTVQRVWVSVSIYLTVIGWAYAIGSLLSTLRDRSLRYAWDLQRLRREVRHLPEPFWIIAGYGETGELLGLGLDDLGRRFVAIDVDDARIQVLDLGSYRASVPGIVGDARNPDVLDVAGIAQPRCAGVIAVTDDEEANLAVSMAAAVLRPDLPVMARASDPDIQRRMSEFGSPAVIDPFDRFGDHLGLVLRAPTAEQLSQWLTSPPGTLLPDLPEGLHRGRWVVCGSGRFGRHVVRDLRRDGLDVVAIDVRPLASADRLATSGADLVTGNGTDPAVLRRAGVETADGFVAGTDNDTTNLSLIAAARRVNPRLSVVARQNRPANHTLFEAMRVDLLMIPSHVVARDALSRAGTPMLWQFLQELGRQDEAWSAQLLARLVDRCGHRSPDLWRLDMTAVQAPALARLPGAWPALGDLLRDPLDRDQQVGAVTLLLQRGATSIATPGDDERLVEGDALLVAGTPAAYRALETTVQVDSAAAYVLTGRHVPAGWMWRRLANR
jgi:voltage-gated potassium channel